MKDASKMWRIVFYFTVAAAFIYSVVFCYLTWSLLKKPSIETGGQLVFTAGPFGILFGKAMFWFPRLQAAIPRPWRLPLLYTIGLLQWTLAAGFVCYAYTWIRRWFHVNR